MAETSSTRRLPLDGVRVLDLSRVLAGPMCSMILADLGADVIKVERPGRGDETRDWGPPFLDGGMSAYFASVNRDKRSVTLDMAKPAGREVLVRLIERSDVLLENFLPSSAKKLGVTPAELRAINPALVVCSISGFGRTGPASELPGYDFVVQALGGLMSITGEAAGAPMKVGVAVSDVITGLYAALSVIAALFEKVRNAECGMRNSEPSVPSASSGIPHSAFRTPHLDLSLLDCTLASLVNVAQSFLVTGERPRRYGNAHAQIVPYECFKTADGFLVLAVGNDGHWQRCCTALARPDLANNPRFTTNPLRVTNRADLVAELAAVFRTEPTAAWTALLAAADVPHAPVLAVDEAFAQPQVAASEMITVAANGMKLVGTPIHSDVWDRPTPAPPPDLGAHTDAVLAELGLSSEAIAELRRVGVI